MKTENVEESLKSRFGKENPFIVPDGYFDRFAEQMMAHLPEQGANSAHSQERKAVVVSHHHFWQRLRPLLAAAVVVGVICTVGIYLFNNTTTSSTSEPQTSDATPLMSNATAEHADELEQTADYLMMDEQDIYAYLSGE